MEASAFPAPAAVARPRTQIGTPLLRLRSDEQLLALFRAGHDEAFRVIHDRYRQRLFAYTRQMLPRRADAEDALQDIFVRAYSGLRANRRELALRAWLYRVAHNRCIDELRRPAPPPPEVLQLLRAPEHDPITEADQRESLRRLIADVRRLPDQQRSALLMRELGGMSYAELATALGVTVPAVKSLLVRARLALGQAVEARDTACSEIREDLIVSHDRGLRPGATARRHMRDCAGCREFRHQLRGVSRRFGALVPTLGPLGVVANLLGVGGAGGGAAGGAAAVGGAAGSSTAVVSVGAVSASAGHVATLLAAAVVTAGGAVELQHTLPTPPAHRAKPAVVAHAHVSAPARSDISSSVSEDRDMNPAVSSPATIDPRLAVVGTGAGPGTSAARSTALGSGTSPSSPTTDQTKVTVRASGGISTVISGGGVSPSGPAGSSGATSSEGTSTTPTLTPSSTTPSSTDSTQSSTSSTSSTTSSTGSTDATSSGPSTGPSTVSSSPSSPTGTSGTPGPGSSTGTANGGSTSPPQ